MGRDIIKEYMVSLGIGLDGNSLNAVSNGIRNFERGLNQFAGGATASFATAGTAITTFVITANSLLASYMNKIAQAQLSNEMLARQMYTTVENASAITNSLNAMGRSFEEIYLSPELMAQFKELRGMSYQLRPPDEFKEQTKNIRSITFEFTKLKLEMKQAGQWIFYYLNKYLAPFIAKFKKGMQELNDSIKKNMPNWTKEIARVVSWIGRLGVALFTAGQMIYKLFREIPTSLKVAGGALAGFFSIISMGPIGWLIAGLTAILLLIDDYQTHQNKGKSAFAGMWEELDNLKSKIDKNGILGILLKDVKMLGDSVGNLAKALGDLLGKVAKPIGDLLDKFAKFLGFEGMADLIEKNITKPFIALDLVIKSIVNGLDAITKVLQGDLKGAGEELGKGLDLGKLRSFLENYVPGASIVGGIGDFLFGKVSYNQPRPQSQSKVNVNNVSTFNVYGNEPYATATLVSNNINSLNTRNFRGVIA